jgi:hypothetical protein
MCYRLLGPLEMIGADEHVVARSGRRERTLLPAQVLGTGQASVSRRIDAP